MDSFREHLLAHMADNKKILGVFEHNFLEIDKKFANLDTFKTRVTITLSNTNATLKNIETQIGQLLETMRERTPSFFPSNMQKNTRDYIKIFLRSRKEILGNQTSERLREPRNSREA